MARDRCCTRAHVRKRTRQMDQALAFRERYRTLSSLRAKSYEYEYSHIEPKQDAWHSQPHATATHWTRDTNDVIIR